MAENLHEGSSESLRAEELRADDLVNNQSSPNDLQLDPDSARAILNGRKGAFEVINTSSSGEIQLRLPSRLAERATGENILRAGGPMTGLERRERQVEQIQTPVVRERGPPPRAPREEFEGFRNSVVTSPSNINSRGEYCNFDRGGSRNLGLPPRDYQIRGEPMRSNYREECAGARGIWSRRDLSPACVEETCPMRGPQEYFRRVDHPQPRYYREGTRWAPPTTPAVGSHDQIQPRKNRKPATFDGSSSWADYLVHFELVSDLNGWTEQEKALELATCLRGVAQGVLSDIRPENRRHFQSLVSALNNHFQPDNQAELYRAQLKGRLRKRGEALCDLSHDVKRLIRLAYPSAPLEVRDHLARDCFIDSLNNAEMEWSIFQGKPTSVDHAMRLALEYEAFQTGRKRRLDGKADIRFQREEDDGIDNIQQRVAKLETEVGRNSARSSGSREIRSNCFYCSEPGHFIAKCPQRLSDLRQGQHFPYTPNGGRPQGNSNFRSRSGN